MPIRPEMKSRYPVDWPVVREGILVRAGNCCEQCSVPNGALIDRGTGKDAGTYRDPSDGAVYDAETGQRLRVVLGYRRGDEYSGSERLTRVVLTIAHLWDPDPANVRWDNLAALCQMHHLRMDAALHKETARATRRGRRALGDLFEGAERVSDAPAPVVAVSDKPAPGETGS